MARKRAPILKRLPGPTPLGPRLSERALAKLLSLKGEASLYLDDTPTLTELLRWLDIRIKVEKAPPLKPGMLADLDWEPATKRQVVAPEDKATVRSYLGEASDAFGRNVWFSETAEYMYERLMAKREGR